jgi:hypothetical protein
MIASMKTMAAGLALAATCAAHATDAPPVALPDEPQPQGQVVARDAATGRLRAPTADELAALRAAHPSTLRGAGRQGNVTRYHRSGAIGARMDDSHLSYVVVVRQPDGRLAEYCFANQDEAAAALAKPAPAPARADNNLPTE